MKAMCIRKAIVAATYHRRGYLFPTPSLRIISQHGDSAETMLSRHSTLHPPTPAFKRTLPHPRLPLSQLLRWPTFNDNPSLLLLRLPSQHRPQKPRLFITAPISLPLQTCENIPSSMYDSTTNSHRLL